MRRLVMAGVTVAATLLAACGSDDDDDSAASSAATSEAGTAAESTESAAPSSSAGAPTSEAPDETAAPETTSGSTDSAPTEPTGEPIRVGFFNSEESATSSFNQPEVTIGAQAAANYVNDELGGIGGRPIELIPCATGASADGVINCVNEFIDEGVDAVIKGAEGNSGVGVPLVVGAGIPYFTETAVAAQELTTPGVYAFTPGGIGLFGTMAGIAQENGFETAAFAYIDVPSVAGALTSFVEPMYATAGVAITPVALSTTAADFAPQAAQVAAANPDVLNLVTVPGTCISVVENLKNLVPEMPALVVSYGCDSPDWLTTMDSVDAPRYVAAPTATKDASNADSQLMTEVVETYFPGQGVGGGLDQGFAGIMNFYLALSTAEDTSTLDAASIGALMPTVSGVPLFLGAGGEMTCDGQQVPGLPSICSPDGIGVEYLGDGEFGEAFVVNLTDFLG